MRRLALMLLFLSGLLGAAVGLNWRADPYGTWGNTGWQRQLASFIEPRIIVPYRLRQDRPHTVLVGTSRVRTGMEIDDLARDGFFNAGLPGAILSETDAICTVAVQQGTVSRIVWGVDFPVFNANHLGLMDGAFGTEARLRGELRPLVVETLLSWDALDESRKMLTRRRTPRDAPPVPWPPEMIRETLDGYRADTHERFVQSVPTVLAQWRGIVVFRSSERIYGQFRSTLQRARAAGIEVVAFIPPTNEFELELLRQGGQWEAFQNWKRAVAAETGYWDFSGYTRLSREDHLFVDPIHFKPGVGHAILRHLVGADCGACGAVAQMIIDSGAWVDRNTVEAHLARQDAAREARLAQPSYYREWVANQMAN